MSDKLDHFVSYTSRSHYAFYQTHLQLFLFNFIRLLYYERLTVIPRLEAAKFLSTHETPVQIWQRYKAILHTKLFKNHDLSMNTDSVEGEYFFIPY